MIKILNWNKIFRLIPNEFDAKDLIQKCLNRFPENRPSIKTIMSHKFFKDVDWEEVRSKKNNNYFIPEIDHPFDDKYFQSERKDTKDSL